MPPASKPKSTSRSRTSRQRSRPLARTNHQEHPLAEDDPEEGPSVGAEGGEVEVRATSSYYPLGNLGESDDDQQGNPNELAAILNHFNKRTSKAEKEELSKLVTRWDKALQTEVDKVDQMIQATKARVEAQTAAYITLRQSEQNQTDDWDRLLGQLGEHVDTAVSQLDKNAAQLSPKKNSGLKMVNTVLARRAERTEQAKQDFDASLEKHATEEVEFARLLAQNGPQTLHAIKKVLLA